MAQTLVIIIYDGTRRDISDYIFECKPISIVSRNKDFSPNAKGFSFKISQTYPTAAHITGATLVYFSVGGNDVFKGVIDSIYPIEDEKAWGIEVSNALVELKKHKVDYDTMHTDIAANGSYDASDNFNHPNILMYEVMQELWSISGLGTLVDNDIRGAADYIVKNKAVVESAPENPTTEDFLIRDIRVDENMLYGTNIPAAGNNLIMDNYPENKITFYDLFGYFCRAFCLTVRYNSGNWILEHFNNAVADGIDYPSYTIDNDYIYSHKERNDIIANAEYWRNELFSETRTVYDNAVDVSLAEILNEESHVDYANQSDNLNIYDGLVFLLKYKKGGAAATDVYEWDKTATFKEKNILHLTDGTFGLNIRNNKSSTFSKTTYETAIDEIIDGSGDITNVHEIKIDITNHKAIVTEASY